MGVSAWGGEPPVRRVFIYHDFRNRIGIFLAVAIQEAYVVPNFYILEGAQMLPISVPQDYTHTFIAW